jgi:iron complex outermembrane receptor protein
VSLVSAALAMPAFAQQTSTPANPDEVVQLPTFEVGATLREEPLMTVPIPVAVVSGDQMLQLNLRDMSDLTAEMPSLTFRAGASNKDTSLLIRGVGTITTSPGVEPDVSTVVDGVVLARPGQATMDLMDVDHVEVLRGPQGTLFGKNSSVGVINIVSKDPTEQKQGYIDAAYYGSDGNEEAIHAGASGALVPNKLLAAVSFLYDDYSGNLKNIYLNQTVNGFRNVGARAKFLYPPTQNFKATVIFSYVNSYETAPNEGPFELPGNISFTTGLFTPASAAALATISPVVPSKNNLQVNSSLLGHVYDINTGLSAQLEWTVDQFKLTSISAYQYWYNNQYEDTGTAPAPLVGQTVSHDVGFLYFDQYSEELRLTSPEGKFVDFVSGLYFQRAVDTESYRRDIVQEPTAGNLVHNSGDAHYGTTGDNYSAYGEATWHLTPIFRLVTGLRFTDDTLSFYHSRISSSAVAVPGISTTLAYHTGSTDDTGVSGRASLQLDLTKDAMLFATYARGYKGPAYNVFFNQTALQVAPLNPETSNEYEVGLKASGFDNRLQFTATAFDTIYTNYQANYQTLIVGTPVTNLINAGQVSSKGVEADASARLTHYLTVSVSASAINAKVDSFIQPAGAGAVNINGQPLPFAPKFKSNAMAEYRMPLPGTSLFFNASLDYEYQSAEQFQLTETPDTVQGSYGIWNATIGISKPKDGWRVQLMCKNIGDIPYATLLTEAGGMVWREVPRDNGRYFGVALHKDY